MNARITITFIIEDYEEWVNDWIDIEPDIQKAAELALGDLLDEEGAQGVMEMGLEPLQWDVEYPATEAE